MAKEVDIDAIRRRIQALKQEADLQQEIFNNDKRRTTALQESQKKMEEIFKLENNFNNDLNLNDQSKTIPKRLLCLTNALIDCFHRDKVVVSQESLAVSQIVVSNATKRTKRKAAKSSRSADDPQVLGGGQPRDPAAEEAEGGAEGEAACRSR